MCHNTKFSLTTLSIMAFSIKPLNITKPSIMARDTVVLSVIYAECPKKTMLCVVVLNVVRPRLVAPFLNAVVFCVKLF
jgi:hypothetical protein